MAGEDDGDIYISAVFIGQDGDETFYQQKQYLLVLLSLISLINEF